MTDQRTVRRRTAGRAHHVALHIAVALLLLSMQPAASRAHGINPELVQALASGSRHARDGVAPTGVFAPRFVPATPQMWPVITGGIQPPIHGGFWDMRGGGFHFGVDISVDDRRPDTNAPAGRAHAVYALEDGIARSVKDGDTPGREPCTKRRLSVGHYSYWHVDPVVRRGRRIRKGQLIGWTCMRSWHVHVSEWRRRDGRRRWVNPLRTGSVLPFADAVAPTVHDVRFFTPAFSEQVVDGAFDVPFPEAGTELDPLRLRGLVDVRARMDDAMPDGFFAEVTDGMPWLAIRVHPFRADVQLRRPDTGEVVFARTPWRASAISAASVTDSGVPFAHHFAPGSHRYMQTNRCDVAHVALLDCAPAAYWLRMWATPTDIAWNTRQVPNGRYELTVRTWDTRGNHGERTVEIEIMNPVPRASSAQ